MVNAHAEGEVGNVVVGGVIDVPGMSAFEKMEYLRDRLDSLRRSILFEPRGSVCHAVNVLLPASNPSADLAFVIMEATKYPAMSGSTRSASRPSSSRPAFVRCANRRPRWCSRRRVASSKRAARAATARCSRFACACFRHSCSRASRCRCSGLRNGGHRGRVRRHLPCDRRCGVSRLAASPGVRGDLARAGIAIRSAVNDAFEAVHPENAKIRGIPNVVLAGPIADNSTPSATVIGNGRLDRSPTGTGVAARTALLVEAGLVRLGEEVTHRSIFGTSFRSTPVETMAVGHHKAVVSQVAGQAWITGFTQMLVDPGDPLAEGHCPNDVWLTRG